MTEEEIIREIRENEAVEKKGGVRKMETIHL